MNVDGVPLGDASPSRKAKPIVSLSTVPGVDENIAIWERSWDWSREGEEWSDWWGGSRALWDAAIAPRIARFLPATRILEIAPGYGRWTQYLKEECDSLEVVDIAERCLDHCRERFSGDEHISYHLTDGSSLTMLDDRSIDVAFSFDSLVHVEMDVLEAYLSQLSDRLSPDGVGFFHHSNIGAYAPLTALARRVPKPMLDKLIARGLVIDIVAWRAESVTAKAFAQACARVGLSCIGQEMISWEHGPYLTDVLSTFTRPGSKWDRDNVVMRNPLFAAEGRRMRRLYAGS